MAKSYWTDAVKRIFPRAVRISEDFEKKTIVFEIENPDGSVSLEFNDELRSHMRNTFGSDQFEIECRPDSRYADEGSYGAIVKITILEANFPKTP